MFADLGKLHDFHRDDFGHPVILAAIELQHVRRGEGLRGKAILRILSAKGVKLLLCTPTGRAARHNNDMILLGCVGVSADGQ